MHFVHGSLYNTTLMQFSLRLRQANVFFMFLRLLGSGYLALAGWLWPAGQPASWLAETWSLCGDVLPVELNVAPVGTCGQ